MDSKYRFEGDITKSKLEKLKMEVGNVIDKDYDSILFFEMRSEKVYNKKFVGKEFNPFANFL